MSFVLRCLKRVSRWVAGPAALLAWLSMHGLTALVVVAALVVVLAVLGLGLFRWIIDSGTRSDRVNRMILALRGDARSLAPGPSTSPLPASRQHRQTARAGRDAARQPRRSPPPADSRSSRRGEKGDGPLRQQRAVGMVKAPQGSPR